MALHEFTSLQTFVFILLEREKPSIPYYLNIKMLEWIHPHVDTIIMDFVDFHKELEYGPTLDSRDDVLHELDQVVSEKKDLKSLVVRSALWNQYRRTPCPIEQKDLQAWVSDNMPNTVRRGLLHF